MFTTKKEIDKLIIGVNGRVDTRNASVVERELEKIREENPSGKLVIDAEELSYVSSAGLRVFLKLRKKEGALSIINASSEVYDIFDITGFTQMIDIKKKIRQISLDSCQMIGKGGMGTVYRLDEETIVKMFSAEVPLEVIERERQLAQTSFICGVPTAISYDVVVADGCYGLVFEMIRADTLTNAINKNPDKFDEYMEKYVALLKEMHEAKDNKNVMQDMKDIYSGYIDNLSSDLTEEEIMKLREVLDAIPDSKGVVHGDLHSRNIMLQDDELVVIDMAEVTHGSELFDLFALFRDYALMAKRVQPEMYQSILGVDIPTGLRIWDSLIKGYFKAYTEKQTEYMSNLVSLGGLYSACLMAGKNSDNARSKKGAMLEKLIRGAFLPAADQLIMLLKNYK